MNADEYQQLAARTLATAPSQSLSDKESMLVWNSLGLVGEAGEVADLLKKGIFHRHGIDTVQLTKELGDVLWYVAAICSVSGIQLSDAMSANIEKLKLRYPDGFSDEASRLRVDLAGR